MPVKQDLLNENDIEKLVFAFYKLLVETEPINRHFKDLDIAAHLPHVISFWKLILLEIPGYMRNTSQRHAHLNFEKKDFEQWLNLFNHTLDTNFKGQNVEKAKQRAKLIAITLEAKFLK